jgi:hypothetical protein
MPLLPLFFMGTNPSREKSPNRNMGREMGAEEEKPEDVNVQEIASDVQSSSPGQGTNFSHVRKEEE